MSNMKYCRFFNTRDDLEECLEAIREDELISDSEVKAGRGMFIDFLDFCREYCIIDSYDTDEIKRLFENMKEPDDDEDEDEDEE